MELRAPGGRPLAACSGFAARLFGRQVRGREVLAALQDGAGVIGADLDRLIQVNAGLTVLTSKGPDGSIPARSALWQGNSLQPADLLLLDPAAVNLTERTS